MASAVAPLALSTTDDAVRPVVVIDGERYELAVSGDLGIAAQAKMQRLVARWGVLNGDDAASISDEDIDAIERDLVWSAGALVRGADGDVLSRLSDAQRVEIIGAFSEAVAANQAAVAKTTTRKRKS